MKKREPPIDPVATPFTDTAPSDNPNPKPKEKPMTMFCRIHLTALLLSLLSMGCATAPKVVEGPRKLTTVKLDTQDFASKAEEMIRSLLESGVLDGAKNKPAILVVGRIVNNTTEHLETDLLTKKIRVALNQSGKAMTDITGGALQDPDFTLSGKIIESRARVDRTRQRCYTFQLSLSNPQGLAVWEDEREVCKQETRAAVGF